MSSTPPVCHTCWDDLAAPGWWQCDFCRSLELEFSGRARLDEDLAALADAPRLVVLAIRALHGRRSQAEESPPARQERRAAPAPPGAAGSGPLGADPEGRAQSERRGAKRGERNEQREAPAASERTLLASGRRGDGWDSPGSRTAVYAELGALEGQRHD